MGLDWNFRVFWQICYFSHCCHFFARISVKSAASGALPRPRIANTAQGASSQLWLAFAKIFFRALFLSSCRRISTAAAQAASKRFCASSQPVILGLWRRKTAGRAYHLLLPVLAFRLIQINLAIFGKLKQGLRNFRKIRTGWQYEPANKRYQDNCSTKNQGYFPPCRLGVWLHCFHFFYCMPGKNPGQVAGRFSIK